MVKSDNLMKHLILFFFLGLPTSPLFSQALTSFNFKDVYNPEGEVSIHLLPVKSSTQIEVHFKIESKQFPIDQYVISWERRESFTQREGSPLEVLDNKTSEKKSMGSLSFQVPTKPWLLVVKVKNIQTQKIWIQFKKIEAIYPVIGWFEFNNELHTQKYLNINQTYQLGSLTDKPFTVSYYTDEFIAALPPFAETNIKADRFLFHDSTFQTNQGSLTLTKIGLYLFQKDTTIAEGFAVRAVGKSFPKFSTMQDVIKPLVFICTLDEYTAIENAKGDKSKIDKVILDITGDKDRAASFMKNYFRRVELANLYFSSYKEGWKTDRGMIYLIFGVPDEVTVNDSNEVWYYSLTRSRFTFVKSGSVYDPDNFVLLRDKRFTEAWYSTIDLWRKSRF
jgi:GWxTD domain-containing protein